MNKKGIFRLIVLLFFGHLAMGQQITGVVTDATTHSPIAGATVFINNTTVGTSTIANGSFRLNFSGTAKVEIVVTAMGYQTAVMEQELTQGKDLHLQVKMISKPELIDEVTVTPFEKDGWATWGRLFTETFIGTTPNAEKTALVNHEVVKFRYDRGRGILEAIASEPLKIDNHGLGYRIQYQLEVFRMDFGNKTTYVAGYPFYSEMEGSKSTLRRFKQARLACYESSLLRFIRTLYVDSLAENGYEVRRMTREPNMEKQRVRALMRSKITGNSGKPAPAKITISNARRADTIRIAETADSTAYYDRILKQDDYIIEVSPEKLTADSIVTEGGNGQKVLSFDNYLQIRKLKLKKDPKYMAETGDTWRPLTPVSWLIMGGEKQLIIEPNGHYSDPAGLYTALYWAWLGKVADLLPIDYESVK